ncbi:low affinity Fe/Cu permease [Mucilaginibacter oryzae]|uniref:Low affinity Fe/Cu permease n=1 Tax=Mucilaginibacter oryzae TaxID=468058 RepID=A0A316HFP7_9SPHI|nr:low affinity iron permease family protein [Mucilaginibacter oryzae]PWK78840.1 low affinity Fe/Cu permease [Mucilaginibacter oryzae]
MTEIRKKKKNLFERFANWATVATGSSGAFIIAFTIIIIWGVTGPLFHYSDTWQLVINTGTTIVTFLMVFLIQKSQNKDSKAIHLKLNELLASHQGASNRMVDIEDITEKELDQLHKFYVELSELAEEEDDITCTHSIDAAKENHTSKLNSYKTKPHYINARNQGKKSN